MTCFTIKSRKYGKMEFCLPRTASGLAYVRLGDYDGKQICHGGGFYGDTIMATPETLPKVCRSWWQARRRELDKDVF
jgi:hypothetical protein